MERPTEAGRTPPSTSPPEPVQRWRLVFAREPVPPDGVGRAAMEAWQGALAACGLRVAGLEPGGPDRARFVLGAPLAAACAGRAELADIWLLERVPASAVREALQARMPPAHRWVGAENVWLGAPPLPGQVVAADWLISLANDVPAEALAHAARSLMEAASVPRVRARAGAERAYDLRPLVDDVAAGGRDDAGRETVRMVTRLDPALGSGRPEEVVAALGEVLALDLDPVSIVRQRLILAEPRRASAAGPPAVLNRRRRR